MQPLPEIRETEPRSTDHIGSLVNELATRISAMGTGDRAELRRGDPDDPGGPAFWKLVVSHLAPRGFIDLDAPHSATLSKWVVILAALAELEGLHNPRAHLGRALAEAGYSELRLTRLLRSEGSQLLDLVRQMVRFLASKAVDVDVADIARLVLSDGDWIRHSIASRYYATQET